MEQDGGGTTMAAPILNLKASGGFGTGDSTATTSSAPVQLQKTSSPASKLKNNDLLKQIRTWLSWWNVPEKKVLTALKRLSNSQKQTVLSQRSTYLDPMAKAFDPSEMATALKSLGETDAHRAILYLFKAKGWLNYNPSGDNLHYFLTHGNSASLMKLQQDKALLKKLSGLWIRPITGRADLSYSKMMMSKANQSPQTVKEEIAGGISSKEKIGGTTTGFVNLRSRPAPHSSTYIGKLDGKGHSVTVNDKKIQDGHSWYKSTFKDPAAFNRLFNPKAPKNQDVQAAKANHYAWVSAKGLDLNVSYSQFMRQLKGWEKAHPKLTVKQRITKLRQMGHSSNLPFGTVIGKSQGGYFNDHRPDFSDLHQIIHQAQGVVMPDGKKIDMYHFLVGLDVLEKSNPRKDHKRIGPFCLGENYAAATWAGDIGAGVADMVLLEGSHGNAYEQHFSKRQKDHKKRNLAYYIKDVRRKHYFKTRAPEADLLADIDAWAGAANVGETGMNSISDIAEKYYGQSTDKTGKTLYKNRGKAIENFLRNYNFRKADGLMSQNDPVKRMNRQVYRFAKIWLLHKKPISLNGLGDILQLLIESKAMTKMFLIWLESLAKQYKVKI